MYTISRRRLSAVVGAAAGAAVVGTTAVPAVADPGWGSEVPRRRADELLRLMKVSAGEETADGPVWSPVATGFASVATEDLPEGAVGGLGGQIVAVGDGAELAEALLREGPTVVLVEGTIELPLGEMLDVSADTSVLGVGRAAEIVGGGLRLLEVSNVVIRNLTFRDSFVPGDWDGDFDDNDNDGIRVDTSDRVWIDHCEFVRLGDGQVDVRKDATNVTISWCIFRDHNKTLGVGWTDNLVTTLTLHHNRFSNTHQRNGSIDNVAVAHAYNIWHTGHSSYGMSSRGATQLLIENSLFEHVRNPMIASEDESRIHQRGSLFDGTWGSHDDTGVDIDPADHYAYEPDPVEQVTELLTRHAGPSRRKESTGRQIRVAQDGSGDVASIHAAIGAALRADHDVEIIVAPGTYREAPVVWPGLDGLIIRGESEDPADVVLTYDKSAQDWATLTVLSSQVTLRALTLENTFEAPPGSGEALALRRMDDSTALEDVVISGDEVVEDPRS